MMGSYGGGMAWGGWLFMGLFWLVLLGVVLYVVVRLLPLGGSGGTGTTGAGGPVSETPKEILDRRFARGEIDAETYQAQCAVLAQSRGTK